MELQIQDLVSSIKKDGIDSANQQAAAILADARKQADGSWTYSVLLSRHNTTGAYFIHAYGNSKQNLVAHTTAYVI